MFLPDEDFTAIKNTMTLTPIAGVSYGPFLYYLFRSIQLPIRGAGQPFMSKGDIQQFTVRVPSLLNQHEAAVICSEVELSVQKLEQEWGRGEALAKSLFSALTHSILSGAA